MENWYIRVMIGIYKITSPTKRVYIGQSWDIKSRFRIYKCTNGRNQRILQRSFLKYGFDKHKFEILHQLPIDIDQSILDAYEEFYLDQYKSLGFNMLNIKDGGSGGKHSPETKNLQSKRQKEVHDKNPNRNFSQWSPISQYTMKMEFVKQYKNVSQASKETGICYSCISNCASKRTSNAGGFLWKREKDG